MVYAATDKSAFCERFFFDESVYILLREVAQLRSAFWWKYIYSYGCA